MANPMDPNIAPQPYPVPGGAAPGPGGWAEYPDAQADTTPNAGPPIVQPAEPAAGFDTKGRVRRTRSSGAWVGLILTALVLILLIIFIAQNTTRVSIKYLGFNGHMSLGLLILLAAIIGLLIAAVPGSIRILQLRRALLRNTPTGQRSGS